MFIKVLFIFFLIWLVYRLVRGLLFISRATRPFRNQPPQDTETPEPRTPSKLIPKDEGEYVDYEEIDDENSK